jgi:hypothetical protein
VCGCAESPGAVLWVAAGTFNALMAGIIAQLENDDKEGTLAFRYPWLVAGLCLRQACHQSMCRACWGFHGGLQGGAGLGRGVCELAHHWQLVCWPAPWLARCWQVLMEHAQHSCHFFQSSACWMLCVRSGRDEGLTCPDCAGQ